MAIQAGFSGVAYDTVKDPKIEGVYRARCAYDDKHEGEVESLKSQTLLNGVQALQKDGYDLVAWSGPYTGTLTSTTLYRGMPTSAKVYQEFDFIVRGWKSAAGNARSGARPISVALVELRGRAEQPASAAAITAPVAAATSSSRFVWPVQGEVVLSFGEDVGGKKSNGIEIKADKGTPVKAADGGVVMIAVKNVGGLGYILMITHSGGYSTSYVYNDSSLVKQGDTVTKGQPIATIGMSNRTSDSRLHFEVHRGKEAVDPMSMLPSQ